MRLMNANRKLTIVKVVHTLIWIGFNVVIFYLLYAVIADRIDRWVWICLGLILLEALILIAFKNVCPLTIIARNYSGSGKANFDIFLPNWLAKYNKEIYTGIVFVAIIILIYRLV